LELGYDPETGQRGIGMATKIGIEIMLKDVAAALYQAQSVVGDKRAGVVGFCLGGSLAWLAATRLNPAAAVGYYGGQIAQYAQEEPRCPVMLHFGAKDAHIGPEKIDQIQRAHPKIPIFMYDAGHGFNCDQRGSYEAASAKLARERTLEFLCAYLSR
jgi:carboxymethylenebutenolidase